MSANGEESFEGFGNGALSPITDDSHSGQDNPSALVSARVASMATRLYDELAKLLPLCGEEALGSVTPLLVEVLQSLDGAMADLSDSQQALEEAIDDNEQLHAQYEKEKKLRRDEQHMRMRNEDQNEDERRELAELVEQLRQHNRKLSSQLTLSRGRAESSEERLERLRQENTDLTHKYRRVNHALQQYLQRGRLTPAQRGNSNTARGGESGRTIVCLASHAPSRFVLGFFAGIDKVRFKFVPRTTEALLVNKMSFILVVFAIHVIGSASECTQANDANVLYVNM